jgi:ribosomal protein S11
MSNSVEFAADIAARDAMTLTKSTFVYVADATADETVSAGAGTMQAIKKSQTSVGLYAKQSTHKTSSETEYIKELDKLVD